MAKNVTFYLNMKQIGVFIILSTLLFCTPKGPQTFNSSYIGKMKSDLIAIKGAPKEIRVFDNAEAYIYKIKEEYYGKKMPSDKTKNLTPKKIYEIEHIYYINAKEYIYKYQVWKKRIK